MTNPHAAGDYQSREEEKPRSKRRFSNKGQRRPRNPEHPRSQRSTRPSFEDDDDFLAEFDDDSLEPDLDGLSDFEDDLLAFENEGDEDEADRDPEDLDF